MFSFSMVVAFLSFAVGSEGLQSRGLWQVEGSTFCFCLLVSLSRQFWCDFTGFLPTRFFIFIFLISSSRFACTGPAGKGCMEFWLPIFVQILPPPFLCFFLS